MHSILLGKISYLDTSHIKLSATLVIGTVEGDDLISDKVFTIWDAGGDLDVPFSGVCEKGVYCPGSSVEASLYAVFSQQFIESARREGLDLHTSAILNHPRLDGLDSEAAESV